jgi:hypothetical protein
MNDNEIGDVSDGEAEVAKVLAETQAAVELPTLPAEGVAWSLEDAGEDHLRSRWHNRLVWAVLVTLLCAISIAVAGFSMELLAHLAQPPAVTVAAPRPEPTPTTTPTPTAAPAPPPTQTVTVRAAPPPPVPQTESPEPPANLDFVMCPSTRDGVASAVTSCAFADNVRRGYYEQGMPETVIAYSPVTGQVYAMHCFGPFLAHFTSGETLKAVKCVGGDDAEVVVW